VVGNNRLSWDFKWQIISPERLSRLKMFGNNFMLLAGLPQFSNKSSAYHIKGKAVVIIQELN